VDVELAGWLGAAVSVLAGAALLDSDFDSLGAVCVADELERESVIYQPEPLNTMPVA